MNIFTRVFEKPTQIGKCKSLILSYPEQISPSSPALPLNTASTMVFWEAEISLCTISSVNTSKDIPWKLEMSELAGGKVREQRTSQSSLNWHKTFKYKIMWNHEIRCEMFQRDKDSIRGSSRNMLHIEAKWILNCFI